MKQKEIAVLIIEPMRLPRVATIPNCLAALQHIVGGLIEVIAPFNDTAAVICNEEGKLLGLPRMILRWFFARTNQGDG